MKATRASRSSLAPRRRASWSIDAEKLADERPTCAALNGVPKTVASHSP